MKISDKYLFIILWIIYYAYRCMNNLVFEKGSAMAYIVHPVLYLYILIYAIRKPHLIYKFLFIYIYIVFLFILTILSSSKVFESIEWWLSFSIPFLCLPIGYDLFHDKDSIEKMWLLCKAFIIIFIVNYIVSNFFDFGLGGYGEQRSGLYLGNLFYDTPYTNVIVLTFVPLALRVLAIKNKLFYLVFYIFSIGLFLAILKRTTIVLVCISFMTYIIGWFFLTKRYGRIRFFKNRISLKYYVLFFSAIIVCIYIFADLFTVSLENRSNRFERGSLEKEGRTRELVAITNDVIMGNDVKTFFVGKETFVLSGTYGHGEFGTRNIHDLWGILINGTGVIGIIAYAYVLCYILYLFFLYRKRVYYQNNVIAYYYTIIFISCWQMFHMASFSDVTFIFPSITFTMMGMILRYFADGGNIVYIQEDE